MGDFAVKTWIKTLLMAGGLCLAGTSFMPGNALAQVKSLESGVKIDQTNAAPEVHNTVENQRLTRAFRQQPPLVPHRVEKYQIDLKVNQCLRCHDWPYNAQERAPKVSETHYMDREGKRLDKVASTRWFCTQCHVPVTDAKPLVNNLFAPTQPAN